MDKTWRSLIYIGRDGFDGWYQFAVEDDSPRLNGKGGLGWLIRLHDDEVMYHRDEHVACYCDEYDNKGTCWHVEEAPKALRYWVARLQLGETRPHDFDELWHRWWPRRLAIDLRCEEQGSYKGKAREEWQLWFCALLDEFEARTVAVRNLERAWGAGVAEAMGVKQ